MKALPTHKLGTQLENMEDGLFWGLLASWTVWPASKDHDQRMPGCRKAPGGSRERPAGQPLLWVPFWFLSQQRPAPVSLAVATVQDKQSWLMRRGHCPLLSYQVEEAWSLTACHLNAEHPSDPKWL